MRKQSQVYHYTTQHISRCTHCDETLVIPTLAPNQYAECPRCDEVLSSGSRWSLHRCSMIALSILILMPFALNYPLLSIDLLGTRVDASVWQGV